MASRKIRFVGVAAVGIANIRSWTEAEFDAIYSPTGNNLSATDDRAHSDLVVYRSVVEVLRLKDMVAESLEIITEDSLQKLEEL